MFEPLGLSNQVIENMRSVVSSSLNEDRLTYEVNQDLLIGETTFSGRILEFEWEPIFDEEDVVANLILVIRDATALRQMKEKAETELKQNQIVNEIINAGIDRSHSILKSFEEEMSSLEQGLPQMGTEQYKEYFICLHTYKGNFRTVGFKILSEEIHDLESMLRSQSSDFSIFFQQMNETLQSYIDIITTKFRLALKNSRENQLIEELDKILSNPDMSAKGKLDQVEKMRIKSRSVRIADLITPIENSLPSISKTLEKNIPKIATRLDGYPINSVFVSEKHAKSMESLLTQLIRNSLAHGFGKDQDGGNLDSGFF